MSGPTVITAREVARYLRSIGVDVAQFEARDELYACVDKKHMLGAHYDSVARLLFDLGLTYDETFDCEDFSMTYVWWATLAHRKAQREAGEFAANAPAVFECWIAGITHAVVLCIGYDPTRRAAHGTGLRHFFVEPQPMAARRELAVAASQIPTISLVK